MKLVAAKRIYQNDKPYMVIASNELLLFPTQAKDDLTFALYRLRYGDVYVTLSSVR
jgi:hypothetical protein